MIYIRERRLAAGLTQMELAKKASVPQSAVAEIEKNVVTNPRIETVLKLATALGCTVEELAKPKAGKGSRKNDAERI